MGQYVVTFARGFGTGGKEIASKLAAELGIHCYENRILTLASQMSGLDENVFAGVNEKIRSNGGFSGFLRGLPRSRHYITRNEKFVSDDTLFAYQRKIIAVSYTHLRAHETREDIVCRLLLEKKKID